MFQDMTLAGLVSSTQANYVRAVAQLASHYDLPPDQLTEEQVRQYLLDLIEVRHAARDTFLYKSADIRFFYVQTLGRDWPLFSKKTPDSKPEASAKRALARQRRRFEPRRRTLARTALRQVARVGAGAQRVNSGTVSRAFETRRAGG